MARGTCTYPHLRSIQSRVPFRVHRLIHHVTGKYTVTIHSVYSNISTRVLDASRVSGERWTWSFSNRNASTTLHHPSQWGYMGLSLARSLWVARAPGLQRSRPHNEKMWPLIYGTQVPVPSWFSVSLNATNQFTMKAFTFQGLAATIWLEVEKKKEKWAEEYQCRRPSAALLYAGWPFSVLFCTSPCSYEVNGWRQCLEDGDSIYHTSIHRTLSTPYSIHGTWSQTPAPLIYEVYNTEYRVSCKLYSVQPI